MYDGYFVFDYLYPELFLEYVDYIRINNYGYNIINTKSYVILSILKNNFKFENINTFLKYIKNNDINMYDDIIIEDLFKILCSKLCKSGILSFEEKYIIIDNIIYNRKVFINMLYAFNINNYKIITSEVKEKIFTILNEIHKHIIIIYIDKHHFFDKYYNNCITEKINNIEIDINYIEKYINEIITHKYTEYRKLDIYYPLGFVDTHGIKYYFEIDKKRKYIIIKIQNL